jgi:hypothetical protein
MSEKLSSSPLATDSQREGEKLALRLIEHARIRAARESARAVLLADPVAQTLDGSTGLDRALDQWVLALTMRVINADAWRPKVLWNVYNVPRRWFGHTYLGGAVAIDNPDNTNREIPIDGASSYEIRGRFGKPATQFTAEIVTDFDGYAGLGRTLSALTTQQIVADEAGNFTITVDAQPAGGRVNHLQSEPGRLFVFTRDSMASWRQVPTALSVERIGGPAAPPARAESQIIDDIVASMPVWVRFWCGFKDTFLGYPAPNKLIGPIGRPGGWGFLFGGRFHVADDEAIVVTTIDGGANYTGFQVSDPWTISPDPLTRLASLNKSQALPNADGSYVYVLSTRDPGVHNWIDTVGLHEGWMLLRWQGVLPTTVAADLVRSVATVKLDQLDSVLPPGTPAADLRSRSAQIKSRIEEHALRFIEEGKRP